MQVLWTVTQTRKGALPGGRGTVFSLQENRPVCSSMPSEEKLTAECPLAHVVDVQKLLQPEKELNAVYDTVYVVKRPVLKSNDFTITLTVNGTACQGLLDTGATRTLITEDLVLATSPSSTTLRAYDANKVETVGVADVTIQAEDQSCNCTCFVVLVGQPVLFGRDVINQLQLLTQTDVNLDHWRR